MNRINYSNWTFTDADIVSGSVAMENAMMFDSLNPDELTVEVISHSLGTGKVLVQPTSGTTLEWYTTVDGRGYVVNDGDIRDFTYGAPVWYYYDGVLQGKYYIKSVERLSIDHFRINAFSMVGMWTNIQDYGGLYGTDTNNPDTVENVLEDIINGGRNYIQSTESSSTNNGVTFTKISDDTWQVSGTAGTGGAEGYLWGSNPVYPHYQPPKGYSYWLSIESNGAPVSVSVTYNLFDADGRFVGLRTTTTDSATRLPLNQYGGSSSMLVSLWLVVDQGETVYDTTVRVRLTKNEPRYFTYTVDPDVAAVNLYGWLPIASVRDNVQQVLFAIGASITKDSVGNPHIQFLRNNQAKSISNDRVYIGGQLSYKTPATTVQVTEHTFYQTDLDVRETLFDNTDSPVGYDVSQLVTFDKPYYGFEWQTTSGATPVSTVGEPNYAYVFGSGILTGKPYTHTTRSFSIGTGVVGEPKEAKVEKATLVSPVNSANVAQRVADYQATAEEVACGIVLGSDNIKCGTLVSFTDPYGEATQGLVSKMNLTMSGKSKSDCTIIKGYTPSHFGNNFTSYQLLTSVSGTYTASKTGTIRVVLGQGGQGGSGGSMGTVGNTDAAGVGGAGGVGGSAGKVYVVDISVTAGQTFSYTTGSRGSYGAGQTVSGTPAGTGSSGANSFFGSYSSSSGTVPSRGYMNILSGEIYSLNGTDGLNGGNGGDWGESGENVASWVGGSGAPSFGSKSPIGGGGAAYGNNGGNASPNTSGGTGTSGLGTAGNGANAIPRALPVSLGSGGTGGNGGGGTGRAPLSGTVDYGHHGTAGTGSNGTSGGRGYIIVYE